MRVISFVCMIFVVGCSNQSDYPTLPTTFVAFGLSAEQRLSIHYAISELLPDNVSVEETYGYKMFDGDALRALVFSTPVNVRASAYDVHKIACSYFDSQLRTAGAPDNVPTWHCRNAGMQSNVFFGSIDQTLWLGEGVDEQDGLAILKDALSICKLEFDILYSHKPRLVFDSRGGNLKFSARGCHYQYQIRNGAAIRGKAFHADTFSAGS